MPDLSVRNSPEFITAHIVFANPDQDQQTIYWKIHCIGHWPPIKIYTEGLDKILIR